jgi:hypothetical protein
VAQRLTTICDFCISDGRESPNLGTFQSELTIRETTLVADVCDEHMGILAVGFHPRRGRAASWLQELRGEEPVAPKQRRKRQPVEAETPEEPEGEPDAEAEPAEQEDILVSA